MLDEKNYNVLTAEKGVPIKACTKGVQLEHQEENAQFGELENAGTEKNEEAGQVFPPPRLSPYGENRPV